MDDLRWRLYVRWPGQKRFKPANWRTGEQVTNLIYATMFTDLDRATVDTELHKMREHNPGMEWEFRTV